MCFFCEKEAFAATLAPVVVRHNDLEVNLKLIPGFRACFSPFFIFLYQNGVRVPFLPLGDMSPMSAKNVIFKVFPYVYICLVVLFVCVCVRWRGGLN